MMNKDEASVKILKTKDFSQFKTLKCNRPLDDNLVKMLKKSVESNDLLAYNPILVNDRMEIIDGQHRLAVCKVLNHDVYYIVTKGLKNTSNYVRDLNVNKKNWDNEAYLNFYTANKTPLYMELSEFMKKNDLTLMSAVCLFSNNTTTTQQFRRGKLVKNDSHWNFVIKALNDTKFANHEYSFYLMNGLLRVLNKRQRGFSESGYNRLLEKLEYSAGVKWSNTKRYEDLFDGKIEFK